MLHARAKLMKSPDLAIQLKAEHCTIVCDPLFIRWVEEVFLSLPLFSNRLHGRYGPKSCPIYKAGPTRKVPGRKGMSWEEEDWIDEEATAHRGMDE